MNSGAFLKMLDRWAWFPAGIVGRLLGMVWQIFRGPAQGVLLLRPGGMGDLVLLSLAWQELGFSEQPVTWLIEKRSEPWARHLGLRYLCYDRSPLRVLFQIAGRFEKVINTEQLFGLSQAFALAALGRHGALSGFATSRARIFLTHEVPYDPYSAHEYLEFKKLLLTAIQPHNPQVLPGQLSGQGEAISNRRSPASGPMVVAIAGQQIESRKLTLDQWVTLVSQYCGSENFILSASPEDVQFQRALAEKFGPQCEVIQGSFNDLCQRIAKAKRLITLDGGMVHVASYYGVPVTAVFTSGRLSKWAPLGKGSRVIVRRDLGCQPCTLFGQVPPCSHAFACRDLDFEADFEPGFGTDLAPSDSQRSGS